ncbi:MAG: amidohydrolase family protein [Candidatus Dormibacteria bacterium]
MITLSSERIFDGTGGDPFGGQLSLAGGRIRRVERGLESSGSADGVLLDLGDYSVLPGLIDAHTHMGLVDIPPDPGAAVAVVAAQIFENLRLALLEGFTTIRDLGGIDGGVVEAVNRGLVPGPRILPSGPLISESGGHGDWRPGYAHGPWQGNIPGLVQPAVLADGVAGVRLAGRSSLRDGATQLKAAISGGFSSSFDRLDDFQFSVDELRAQVEVAQARHTYVTGHAHHSEAVHLGLQAGLECFEHGTFLDQDAIDAMSAQGASLVATLSPVESYQDPARRQGLRDDLALRAAAAFPAMARSVTLAIAAGITVGSGSDLTGAPQTRRGRELAVRSQVTNPLEAITAATSANARILRLDSETGSLREGLSADLVVLEGNPLDDPDLFNEADKIRLVILRGRVYKNTLPDGLAQAVDGAFAVR